MKIAIKIIIFIIASLFILVINAQIKQELHNAGKPAAISWIGMGIIFVLFYIMFVKGKKKALRNSDKDITLKK